MLQIKWMISLMRNVCFQFILLRVSSVFLIQTSFVPDEYWQSPEVAHKLVFGYGYQTWEWKTGIRSSITLLPVWLSYLILHFIHLDYRSLLIAFPRLLYSCLHVIGDCAIYESSKIHYGVTTAYYTKICMMTSWFLYYCASRTLVNNLEQILVSLAWYFYSRKTFKKNITNTNCFLMIISIAVAMRPTSSVLLGLIWLLYMKKEVNIRFFLFCSFSFGTIAIFLNLLLDTIVYGRLLLTPWEFLKFNVITDSSSMFGAHPWYWYITQGVPVVLASHLILVALAAYMDWDHNITKLIFVLGVIHIVSYSFISHKEFRFILPILPLILSQAGRFLSLMSPRVAKKWIIFLWASNIPLVMYLGLVHQRGPLDVVTFLHEECYERLKNGKDCSIFQLMPCHSTPHLSHLHLNISMNFLSCEPNLHGVSNYIDEADLFYNDIKGWIDSHSSSLSVYLVMFDEINQRINASIWRDKGYRVIRSIFHTHIPSGRQGSNILVYKSVND